MLDIGFSELMVIGMVALVVIGPKDLPRVARTAGHLMGRLRRYVSDVKSDISREMEIAEFRSMQENLQESARELQESFTRQTEEIKESFTRQTEEIEQELHRVIAPAAVEQTAVADAATPVEAIAGVDSNADAATDALKDVAGPVVAAAEPVAAPPKRRRKRVEATEVAAMPEAAVVVSAESASATKSRKPRTRKASATPVDDASPAPAPAALAVAAPAPIVLAPVVVADLPDPVQGEDEIKVVDKNQLDMFGGSAPADRS
jgi:sec-independent protein translocase protein TatB